ncbi:MAG: hypothetical protein ACXADS_14890 [Candidatus Thorarchaeota archaeon]
MSGEVLDKSQIIDELAHIAEHLVNIAAAVDTQICKTVDGDCESDWDSARESVGEEFKAISPHYRMAVSLPSNELGITALEAISSIVRIRGAFRRIVLMIDMVRDVDFQPVYMDALGSISKKVYEAIVSLQTMVTSYGANRNAFAGGCVPISKREIPVDEENIIISRQIEVTEGGDSPFVCYVMRKIVGELENITDYLRDLAEVIEGL